MLYNNTICLFYLAFVYLPKIKNNNMVYNFCNELHARQFFDSKQKGLPENVNDLRAKALFAITNDNDENSVSNLELENNSGFAKISINGAITQNGYFDFWECQYNLGTNDLLSIVKKLKNDSRIKGLLLEINSGGGEVYGTDAFANELLQFRKQKKIIAYTKNTMASAAIWIGSCADEIYATADICVFGSIGTMATYFIGNTGMWGGEIVSVYSSTSTQKNEAYRAINSTKKDESKAVLELDKYNDVFVKHIKSQFEKETYNANGVLQGATFLTQEAKKIGLINGIKTEYEIYNYAKKIFK